MSCNKCNQYNTPCTCVKVATPCNNCPPEVPCDCELKDLDLKCSIYNGLSLTNSGILPKDNGQTVIQKLDKYIKLIFDTLNVAFNLKNIGIGAKIYKGIDSLGKRELRTIVSNNSSINITEQSTEINIEGTVAPLQKIDEGNGEGIIIRNRNSLNYANVGGDAFDISYSSQSTNTNGATGAYSFSTGIDNQSLGTASFTEGDSNIADSQSSHAEGNSTKALGFASHSQGINTKALASASHASGQETTATGEASFAGGYGNDANSSAEMSIGIRGTTPVGNPSYLVQVPTDRVFNVGNGKDSPIVIRSDAFSVFKNGIATLPSITNALITTANEKVIITREYLESQATILNSSATTNITGIGSISNPYKVEITPLLISQISQNTTNISNIISTPAWLVGDVKEVDCTNAYISLNFTANGLGINERVGWAISNGNNGTKDRRKTVPVQYDSTSSLPYNLMGNLFGEETHKLITSEMPIHTHGLHGINLTDPDGADSETSAYKRFPFGTSETEANGGDQPHNNMQPSIITLFIQKI
jgi:hypothetical protein